MTWIQTYNTESFDYLNFESNRIDIEEIAISLSRTCRFKGHCIEWYDNAEHSLRTSWIIKEPEPEIKLAALLHDSHEVYSGFGDVANPAKHLDPYVRDFIKELHGRIDVLIAEAFGFDPALFEHPSVKHADILMLAWERRDVMKPCEREWLPMPEIPGYFRKLRPIGMERAKSLFLSRFYDLCPKEYWNGSFNNGVNVL